MPKLTRQFIESQILLPPSAQMFYRDSDLPGFAVRATPKTKSYIVEKRIDRTNHRITIARCSDMSLDAARKQAAIMLAEMSRGIDPKSGKRINPHNEITLREVLHKFVAVKPLRDGVGQHSSRVLEVGERYRLCIGDEQWRHRELVS